MMEMGSEVVATISRLMMATYQQGFRFETELGGDVKSTLVSELCLDPEVVDKRVQTVFMDGMAVDDLEKAQLREGSVLTLSGAMPGLVGACLRKSGKYAALRSEISYTPCNLTTSSKKRGVITVKLFNSAIPELGPAFLKLGILIDKSQHDELIKAVEESPEKSSIKNIIKIEQLSSECFRIGQTWTDKTGKLPPY